MNLGYCVIFSHGEQGMPMLDVVATGDELERSLSIVESISGYPRDHDRYTFDVFDLTKLYHMSELGMDEARTLIDKLSNFSPESVAAISLAEPVEFTVQAYRPFGLRAWINRSWEVVTKFLGDHLKDSATKAREYRTKQRELRNNRGLPVMNKEEWRDQ